MARLSHERRNSRAMVAERGPYGAKQRTVPPRTTGFVAKYGTGQCAVCHQPIEVGEHLRSWNRAQGKFAHAACCENLA